MHCKASKAPKTQTKYILGLNKDVSTEEIMSYQTKLANQTYFLFFQPNLLYFHIKWYRRLSVLQTKFMLIKSDQTKPQSPTRRVTYVVGHDSSINIYQVRERRADVMISDVRGQMSWEFVETDSDLWFLLSLLVKADVLRHWQYS